MKLCILNNVTSLLLNMARCHSKLHRCLTPLESTAQDFMCLLHLFLLKHIPSICFLWGDAWVSKLHVGGFSLCEVKMCMCVLARASRISAILWGNDAAPQTGKCPDKDPEQRLLNYVSGANTQKNKQNFDPLMWIQNASTHTPDQYHIAYTVYVTFWVIIWEMHNIVALCGTSPETQPKLLLFTIRNTFNKKNVNNPTTSFHGDWLSVLLTSPSFITLM